MKGFVLLIAFIVSHLFRPSSSLPSVIRLGGLFEASEREQELVFQLAVERVNRDRSLLNASKLVALTELHSPDNSFHVSEKVCNLLRTGVAGLFGPGASAHARAISDAFEVPLVEGALRRGGLSVHPYAPALNAIFMDVVHLWGWTNFLIVYEENEGIIRLQDFLKESAYSANWTIGVQRFKGGRPFRDLFAQIRAKNDKALKDICIVLDVSKQHLRQALKEAQQVEMMTVRNKYIITSLDLHTVDLEDFQYSRANITGFRIVDVDSEEYSSLLNRTNARLVADGDEPVNAISTSSALMWDAVWLVSRALQDLDEGKRVDEFASVHCDENKKATDGTSLINYIKSAKDVRGLTGQLHFDGQGFRSSFTLDILQLSKMGLKKIGHVVPGTHKRDVKITDRIKPEAGVTSGFENKKYIITTILAQPFTMLRFSSNKLTGNDRFEGYTVDLVEELSKELKFDYEIRLVADKKHGSRTETPDGRKVWNGMVGEVLYGLADMAVADVTITSKREEVMDFTLPFMNTGITILFKKPTEKVKSLFSFLSPFSGEVWLFVMAAFLGVSTVLFLVGRLSPYEWETGNPCRPDDGTQENCFTLLNSMWFAIASLMQQGCEIGPRASSTRTISGIWYFFTLIMISSYTANLAAFLTVEKVVYPIENADELSRQTKIKYGCLDGGSTKTFFETSQIETYKRMWTFMKENPDVFMDTNDNGKSRVYEGSYAYLMESASIEFFTERECNLTQIGGLLDHKSYGIATKKYNGTGDSMSSWLSGGILKLQEAGTLHTLKERWWRQKRGGGKCVEAPQGSVRELGLGNVGGVFVVLLAGVVLAAAVAALEFLWQFRKYQPSLHQEEIGKLMAKDIKFAFACSSSTKEAPRLTRKDTSQSTNSVLQEVNPH